MLWNRDPERKPCMIFPVPAWPVRHDTHRKHNILSDCTLSIWLPSNTIHCQCHCTEPNNQDRDDDVNAAALARWRWRIACRAEGNEESKWQACQKMSLSPKRRLGRVGTSASAAYPTKADNEGRNWWTREQKASGLGYLNKDTCNKKNYSINIWS